MSSKIWLYQTDRALTQDEIESLQIHLDDFARSWQAHGKELKAKFWFHNPFLLVCEIDESLWSASGCSIDAKVRFLKDIGDRFNTDFFVRMKTIVQLDNHFKQVNFDEVKSQIGSPLVFNPTISSSSQLDLIFTTIEDSPMQRLFKRDDASL